MMKLVLALTALIVMAQAQFPWIVPGGLEEENRVDFPWIVPGGLEEENRMDPEMAELIKAATIQFCKDVANGNDKAAWAYADQALDFQCVS